MSFRFFNSTGQEQIINSVADLPVGAIIDSALPNAPTGWLLCDGSSISRTGFPELFAAIGTFYGSVDANTFTLPDLTGQIIYARPYSLRTSNGLYVDDGSITSAKIAVQPHAVVESAADTVVAHATFVNVVFDTARYDLGTATPQWSAGTNPNRITCQKAGLYYIQFTTSWPPNATGFRMALLFVNGVEQERIGAAGFSLASAGPTLSQSFLFRLVVGNYVNVTVYQESGVSLTIPGANTQLRPRLSMAYLSA